MERDRGVVGWVSLETGAVGMDGRFLEDFGVCGEYG